MSKEKYNYKEVYRTQNFLQLVQLRVANQTGVFLTTSQLFTILRIIFYTIFEITKDKPVCLKFIGTFERFTSSWVHPTSKKQSKETVKFRIGDRARKIITGTHEEYKQNEFFRNEELKPLEYFTEKKKLEKEAKIAAKRLERFKAKEAITKEKTSALNKLYKSVPVNEVKEQILSTKKEEDIFQDLDHI